MLKYLFTAEFNNGELFDQNLEDVSLIDPTKSAFYDVLQREKELVRFHLFDEENNKLFTVDLRDGSFSANGAVFNMHDHLDNLTNEFRLIFFRRVRRHFSQTFTEMGVDTTYRLGWQCLDKDGKNVQRVMEFS